MKDTEAFKIFQSSLDLSIPLHKALLRRVENLVNSVTADPDLISIVEDFIRNGNLERAMRAFGKLLSIQGVALIYALSGTGRADILTSILRTKIYETFSHHYSPVRYLQFIAYFTRAALNKDSYWLTPVMANGRQGPFSPGNVNPELLKCAIQYPIAVSLCNWDDDYTLPNRGSDESLASVLMQGYYAETHALPDFNLDLVMNIDIARNLAAQSMSALRMANCKAWIEAGMRSHPPIIYSDVMYSDYPYIHPSCLEFVVGTDISGNLSRRMLIMVDEDLSVNMIFVGGLNRCVPYMEGSEQDPEVIQKKISSDSDNGFFDHEMAYPFATALKRNSVHLAEVSVESGLSTTLIRCMLRHNIGVGLLDPTISASAIAAGIPIFDDMELFKDLPYPRDCVVPGIQSHYESIALQWRKVMSMAYPFADTTTGDDSVMNASSSSALRITDSTTADAVGVIALRRGGSAVSSVIPEKTSLPVLVSKPVMQSLTPPGFCSVAGNGLCFYNAILAQASLPTSVQNTLICSILEGQQVPTPAHALHAAVLNHVQSNAAHYFQHLTPEQVQSYTATQNAPNAWADHVMVQGTSDLLGAQIQVDLLTLGFDWGGTLTISPSAGAHTATCVFHMANIANMHFCPHNSPVVAHAPEQTSPIEVSSILGEEGAGDAGGTGGSEIHAGSSSTAAASAALPELEVAAGAPLEAAEDLVEEEDEEDTNVTTAEPSAVDLAYPYSTHPDPTDYLSTPGTISDFLPMIVVTPPPGDSSDQFQ